MKRNVYSDLLNWKNSKARNPLLLLGQRQIGKTYILKEFANNEFKDYIYINFFDNQNINNIFIDYKDAKDLLNKIFDYYEKDINELSNTLIIIDEIQESNKAILSLKTLNESNLDIYIVGTGSYLGYKITTSKMNFPIGQVSIVYMKQMMFDEFVLALGREKYLNKVIEQIRDNKEIEQPLHEKMLDIYQQYLNIGGFPEVIKTYINSNFSTKLAKAKIKEIMYGYENDIDKYSTIFSHKTFLRKIYKSIDKFLAKENKKYVFSELDNNKRYRELEKYLIWLEDSNLLYKINNLKNTSFPLSICEIDNYFKLYYNDIGFLTLPFNGNNFEQFKGGISENFVVTQLMNNFNKIYFYNYLRNGKKYEIDFVVENKDNQVCFIEVKSSQDFKLKSLNNIESNNKYVLSPRNYYVDKTYINIPIYLSFMLHEII